MKRTISLLFIIVLIGCSSSKNTDKILIEVFERDQYIRNQMIELTKAVSKEGRTDLIDSLINIYNQTQLIDSQNIAVIDSILENGLPKNLSKESYKTIWIVIDHASLEKQEQYLTTIQQMANENLIKFNNYAILFDRIAMGNNRPQYYGSQTVQFGNYDDIKLYVWPIENFHNIDSIRKSIGMSPMNEYIKQLKNATSIEAIYDSTITIEELNIMRYSN